MMRGVLRSSTRRQKRNTQLVLIHVVASYNGTLSISATADRDALPDPATYAGCLEKAFEGLLAATE
jgi:diacylglycerol O-acyltransferase / wax synthase